MIKKEISLPIIIKGDDVTLITGTKKIVDYISSDEEELRSLIIGISSIGQIQELCFKNSLSALKSKINNDHCYMEWEYSKDVNMGSLHLPLSRNYDSTIEFDHQKLPSSLGVDISEDGIVEAIEIFQFKTLFPEIAQKLLSL